MASDFVDVVLDGLKKIHGQMVMTALSASRLGQQIEVEISLDLPTTED
jgi:hypothetical protein